MTTKSTEIREMIDRARQDYSVSVLDILDALNRRMDEMEQKRLPATENAYCQEQPLRLRGVALNDWKMESMTLLRMRKWHSGFFARGNFWRFRYSVGRYATCTYYQFWRFYISIDT